MKRPDRIPRMLLIGDRFTDPGVALRILEAADAGVPWIQLRDHEAPPDEFADSAAALSVSIREKHSGVLLSVNTRVRTSERVEAGLHLGWRGPSVDEARRLLGEDALIGVSVHTIREVIKLSRAQRRPDYLLWSPVFPTTSKPGVPGTGLRRLADACNAASPMPVIAMGGISPFLVSMCLQAGSWGFAVHSGILAAPDIPARTRMYLDSLSNHTSSEV